MLLYRGIEALAENAPEKAETLLNEALEIEKRAAVDGTSLERLVAALEALQLESRIHMRLARVYTDTGRYDEAREELERANDSLDHDLRFLVREEVSILESRLDLLEADSERAYKRLKKGLKRRGMRDTEGYLLLAIAALEQGDRERSKPRCASPSGEAPTSRS